MDQINISEATTADVDIVRLLAQDIFIETFAEDNDATDMDDYVQLNFTREKMLGEISNPESGFFIAWDNDNPVGYLKVNMGKAQTELQDEASLEIERIYVKGSHHGKKVGQFLFKKALDEALQQQKTYIWLGVWEENHKAIRFYEKNGFKAFSKHKFMLGNAEQTDIMMKRATQL